MRFLIHMGDPYPNESPGAIRMRTFYEALKAAGHEVGVLAPESRNVQFPDVIGFKTIPLKSKSVINRLLNQLSIGFGSLKAAKAFGNADVVITTSPPALISIFGWRIARNMNAKLVYDVRDIWPDVAWEMGIFSRSGIYGRVFEWNRNFMLAHSDLVMAVSHGKVEKLKRYCPDADVVYVTNGLDEKFLENKENPDIVERFGLDRRSACVYIGNLGLAQGLTQLLHIAKRAKDIALPIQFLLFGSGIEEGMLRKFAQKNGLDNVIFPGHLPNADMYTVLKHAQMSFVSLVNENLRDSVPTKIFEALGAGCPVLLAAAGESAQILAETGLGAAAAPNDEESLWNAFVRMYEQRDAYSAKQAHAKDVIFTKYSRQKAAKQMVFEVTKRFQKR